MKKLFSFIFALALTLPMFADEVEAISVAEARARIDANNLGPCYVRGKVKSINNFNPSYTNIIFWLADTEDPTLEIQAYQFNAKDDQPYTSADQIEFKAGDEIIVYAKELLLYNNKTYEMKKGYYVSTVSSVQIDEISVSEALQRIQENKLDPCIVNGKVLRILTKDADVAQYGNVSYWLADLNNPNDSIQAFRMQGKDDQKYASAADIEFVVGDEIQVFAKGLALYNDKIPELDKGYYIKTLKGADVENLNWPEALATVYRQESSWRLEIINDNDEVNLVFALDQEDAIAGSHYLPGGSTLKLNSVENDITSGSLVLTFVGISDDNYNIYDIQFSIVCEEKVYRFNQELDIYAVDEEEAEIILQGDRPFVPTEDNQEVTCEQARSYTLSLPEGTTSEWRLVVHGYITDIFADGQSFWMADTEKGGKVIEAFKFSSVTPASKAIALGAEVTVTGKVQNYNGTPEIKNGKVQIIAGGVDVETIPVTVAEALAIAKALGNSETAEGVYSISGFIAEIDTEYSEKYGNISFKMSDKAQDDAAEFLAYNVACDADLAEQLVPGTEVTVIAKITHFHQNASGEKPERDVYETVAGGTVSVKGTGVEDITTNAVVAKFIHNGQLYIIRANAIYNVQGQLVK